MQYIYPYSSPLGEITLASNGESLTGLWFNGQKYYARSLDAEHEERLLPVFEESSEWLDYYFRGKNPGFTPPCTFQDTPFRLAVWEVLRAIPFGRTITYKEIAREIARQRGLEHMCGQAIGNAVGHNPVSIIVPCHRVVGSTGSLTGYAGGVERKLALLKTERADLSRLYIPAKGTAL